MVPTGKKVILCLSLPPRHLGELLAPTSNITYSQVVAHCMILSSTAVFSENQMNEIVSQVIAKLQFCRAQVVWAVRKREQKAELARWERQGRPAQQPHLIKQQTLREYAKTYGLRILVETGTHWGDMVEAMKADFEHIYSIELSAFLYKMALMRFRGANNIELIQGDSGNELKYVVSKLNQPALFWLDGHYSGEGTARGDKDTPIKEELYHILKTNMGHVIIIDDARCFGVDPAFPSLEELFSFIKSLNSNVDVCVQEDRITITPKPGLPSDG